MWLKLNLAPGGGILRASGADSVERHIGILLRPERYNHRFMSPFMQGSCLFSFLHFLMTFFISENVALKTLKCGVLPGVNVGACVSLISPPCGIVWLNCAGPETGRTCHLKIYQPLLLRTPGFLAIHPFHSVQ